MSEKPKTPESHNVAVQAVSLELGRAKVILRESNSIGEIKTREIYVDKKGEVFEFKQTIQGGVQTPVDTEALGIDFTHVSQQVEEAHAHSVRYLAENFPNGVFTINIGGTEVPQIDSPTEVVYDPYTETLCARDSVHGHSQTYNPLTESFPSRNGAQSVLDAILEARKA